MHSPLARSQYFVDQGLTVSPSESDRSEDYDSDGTIEDIDEVRFGFGAPLQRMVRSSSDDEGSYYRSGFSSCDSETASSISTDSSVVYDIDYEALIDDLLAKNPDLYHSTNLVMVEPSTPTANDSIMMKCLPRNAPELFLILQFNQPEYRNDPWNPIPHLLCAVERKDKIFLCLQRLFAFDKPPFAIVANYIDFFRQMLEGLSFLHEHSISNLGLGFGGGAHTMPMADFGLGTRPPAMVENFDRRSASCPVKYYYDCSTAIQGATLPATYVQDVKDCGKFIERMLLHLPSVSRKLDSLVRAMLTGGFGADDARKLFEALCKSLESSVFETQVPSSPDFTYGLFVPPSFRRTRSHPSGGNGGGIGTRRIYEASTATLVPTPGPVPMVRSQSTPFAVC
ncbi:hypothetical protein CYLTODRAFT_489021 [Cylindrobasidium torrendii FP15055 ss-10]|uniref:Protein kinase domain-containing protein n=1 Tax=Cylindrobasidium torrendii FP15055 ss-10 TaxID=1314674 RepID=A0A0D7BFL6_9AGAR|nr:hypothetical protein CYLTODRAFT_489021 [Cylindrobasidium torrendii FP15055 ss-10]